MSAGDTGEKSELPTPRRREKAREEGQVARSTDLTIAGVSLASMGGLAAFGPGLFTALGNYLRASLAASPWQTIDHEVLQAHWTALAPLLAAIVLPLLLAIMLSSLALNLMQIGFLWVPNLLMPDFSRISPLKGLQRIFSSQSVARLAGGLLKLVLVGAVVASYITSRTSQWQATQELPLLSALIMGGWSLIELGFWATGTLALIAILDYGYQFWQHEQQLMMTKQEIRDEMKEMEGDPLIRQMRREAHRKLALARQIQDVRNADVVITNPTEIAVALKYDPTEMPAPIVVAKGRGEVAARIRREAAAHGVPIIERKPLARAIYKLVNVGQPIPPDLYATFAEILAYVYRITGRKPPAAPTAE